MKYRSPVVTAGLVLVMLAGLFVSAPVDAQGPTGEQDPTGAQGDPPVQNPGGFGDERIPPVCSTAIYVRTCVNLQQSCVRDSSYVLGAAVYADSSRFVYFCSQEQENTPPSSCPASAISSDFETFVISGVDGRDQAIASVPRSGTDFRCLPNKMFLYNSFGAAPPADLNRDYCDRWASDLPLESSQDRGSVYETRSTLAQPSPTGSGVDVEYIYCVSAGVPASLTCSSLAVLETVEGRQVCLQDAGVGSQSCPVGYFLISNYVEYTFLRPETLEPIFGPPTSPTDQICVPATNRSEQCPDVAPSAGIGGGDFFVVRERSTDRCLEAHGPAPDGTCATNGEREENFRLVDNICLGLVLPKVPAPCPGSVLTAENIDYYKDISPAESSLQNAMVGDRLQPDQLFLTVGQFPVEARLQMDSRTVRLLNTGSIGGDEGQVRCVRMFDFPARGGARVCDADETAVEVVRRRENLRVPAGHSEPPGGISTVSSGGALEICVHTVQARQNGNCPAASPGQRAQVGVSSDALDSPTNIVARESCYDFWPSVLPPFACRNRHLPSLDFDTPQCISQPDGQPIMLHPDSIELLPCPASHPTPIENANSDTPDGEPLWVVKEADSIGNFVLPDLPEMGDRCGARRGLSACPFPATQLSVDLNNCAEEADPGACNNAPSNSPSSPLYLLIPRVPGGEPEFCAKLSTRGAGDCPDETHVRKAGLDVCFRIAGLTCSGRQILMNGRCFDQVRGSVGCGELLGSYDAATDRCLPPGLQAICQNGALPALTQIGSMGVSQERCPQLRRLESIPGDCPAPPPDSPLPLYTPYTDILCGRLITPSEGDLGYSCQPGQLLVSGSDSSTRPGCYFPSTYFCADRFGTYVYLSLRPFSYNFWGVATGDQGGATIAERNANYRARVETLTEGQEQPRYFTPQGSCRGIVSAQCGADSRLHFAPDFNVPPRCISRQGQISDINSDATCVGFGVEEGVITPATTKADFDEALINSPFRGLTGVLFGNLGITDEAAFWAATRVETIYVCNIFLTVSIQDASFTCSQSEMSGVRNILVDLDGRNADEVREGAHLDSFYDLNGFPDRCLAVELAAPCDDGGEDCDTPLERQEASGCPADRNRLLYPLAVYNQTGTSICYASADSAGTAPECSTRSYVYLAAGSFVFVGEAQDKSQQLLTTELRATDDGICARPSTDAFCPMGRYFEAGQNANGSPSQTGCHEVVRRNTTCPVGFELDPADRSVCVALAPSLEDVESVLTYININCPTDELSGIPTSGESVRTRFTFNLVKDSRLTRLLNRFLVNQSVRMEIRYEKELECITVNSDGMETEISYDIASLAVDIRELPIVLPRPANNDLAERQRRNINPLIAQAIEDNENREVSEVDLDGLGNWETLTTAQGQNTGDEEIDSLYFALYGPEGPWRDSEISTVNCEGTDLTVNQGGDACDFDHEFRRPGWYLITASLEWTPDGGSATDSIPLTLSRVVSVGELFSSTPVE